MAASSIFQICRRVMNPLTTFWIFFAATRNLRSSSCRMPASIFLYIASAISSFFCCSSRFSRTAFFARSRSNSALDCCRRCSSRSSRTRRLTCRCCTRCRWSLRASPGRPGTSELNR